MQSSSKPHETSGPGSRGRSGRDTELERGDARVQARQLAGNRVLVQHALLGAALHLRLGREKSRLGVVLVAGRDRQLDLLDEGTDAADAGTVDLGPPKGLAETLLSGLVIGHGERALDETKLSTGWRVIAVAPRHVKQLTAAGVLRPVTEGAVSIAEIRGRQAPRPRRDPDQHRRHEPGAWIAPVTIP